MKRSSLRLAVPIATSAILLSFAAAFAQVAPTDVPPLRVGVNVGMNYNYVDVGLQHFIDIPSDPGFAALDFSKADGPELYGGIVGEYDFNEYFGVQLRGVYDARCVEKSVAGSDLSVRIGYVGIEPGFRATFAGPLRFYAVAGPSIHFNVMKEYDYTSSSHEGRDLQGIEMNNVNDVRYGGWIGFGLDIPLNQSASGPALFLTPFIEGSYLFDQKKVDVPQPAPFDDRWDTMTLRFGLQLKSGFWM
jgi:hypothetical protein